MKTVKVTRKYEVKLMESGEVIILIPDLSDVKKDIKIVEDLLKDNLDIGNKDIYLIGHMDGDFITKGYILDDGSYEYDYVEYSDLAETPELLKMIGKLLAKRYLEGINNNFGLDIKTVEVKTIHLETKFDAYELDNQMTVIRDNDVKVVAVCFESGYRGRSEVLNYINDNFDPSRDGRVIHVTVIYMDPHIYGRIMIQTTYTIEFAPELGEYIFGVQTDNFMNFNAISTESGVYRKLEY
jgi:hypothetical protein